jgi:hypothetical protein
VWPSRFVAAVALAAGSLFLLPSAAAAPDPPCAPGLGVGLVDFPSNTRDPRARSYIVDHVAPGAHFSRRFQVCNGSNEAITVDLYASAVEVGGGGFRIADGRGGNELADWISIQPATATLKPGQRLIARATVTVPKAAESGERYAVLLAERPPPKGNQGIGVASRVGIRVYLDVGPGGAPRSDFTVDSLQAARDPDGTALVNAQVHNTGKRALDMTGTLTLRDGPGGLSGGPYAATVGTTLLPGETAPVLVRIVGAINNGPWTALLTLRSGLVERRVEAGLTFPNAGEQAPPVDVELIQVAGDQGLNPLPALLAVGGVLLALVLFVAWRRRTASKREPVSPAS